MSKMKELYEKVAADSTLQNKFAAIMEGAEKAGEETTNAKLLAFAKEAGYDVTLEEMQTFFKGLTENSTRDLSDAELDMAAGGRSQGWYFLSIPSFRFGCTAI